MTGSANVLGLTTLTVVMAVSSALTNIIYMIYLLQREAEINDLNLIDYSILSLQGRFDYIPFVESIAEGRVKQVDLSVDQSGQLFFQPESLRKLVAAVSSKHCRLKTLILGLCGLFLGCFSLHK